MKAERHSRYVTFYLNEEFTQCIKHLEENDINELPDIINSEIMSTGVLSMILSKINRIEKLVGSVKLRKEKVS